jgi:hypothetical protein
MFTNRIAAVVVSSLAMACTALVHAQTKRPDFSGTWQGDTEASRALTLKNGGEWRVAGAGAAAGSAGARPPAESTSLRRFTVITQSERELVVETRYGDEVVRHEVFKLDGSVSVNAWRDTSNRSTTVWKGASLVTTGTMHFDFSDGRARDATGKPITEMSREFVTTRTLMPDGTMQIETWTRQDGQERKQWSVLVRVKP